MNVQALVPVVGGIGALAGGIAGVVYAASHLPAAFAAASAVGGSGGLLIIAAGIGDIGALGFVGSMTVGGPALVVGIVGIGLGVIAYNHWFAR